MIKTKSMLKFQQMEKNMKKYLEILKECRLFDDIEQDDLLKVLNCLNAKIEFFDKQYTIFAEGTKIKHIGIVLSGSVQIIQVDYYGNRSILSNVGAGEIFAEAFSCMQIESIPVSIIANEPSEIMFINCRHILNTCKNSCDFHHKLIFNLMKDLAAKTITFQQKIEVTSKRSTREKLLTYLSIMSKKAGNTLFSIPFDRQELADYLGVERTGLSSEIGKLKKEGILENDKNKFKLL